MSYGETVAWPEGQLHLWTGAYVNSGQPVAWVRNFRCTPELRWRQGMNGLYQVQERRVSFRFGIGYAYNSDIQRLFAQETAVHLKFTNTATSSGPSAGVGLSACYLSRAGLLGSEGGILGEDIAGHGHHWSAFP